MFLISLLRRGRAPKDVKIGAVRGTDLTVPETEFKMARRRPNIEHFVSGLGPKESLALAH